jgi:hypothetical protein
LEPSLDKYQHRHHHHRIMVRCFLQHSMGYFGHKDASLNKCLEFGRELKSFSDNIPTAPAQPLQNVIFSVQLTFQKVARSAVAGGVCTVNVGALPMQCTTQRARV